MQHFKLRLFFFSFIICVLTLSSCTEGDEDINNDKLRNSDYVFYKEEGKPGYWQKISEDSDFYYTKGTLTYFFDNGNLFCELQILDSIPNRVEKFYDKDYEKLIKTNWVKGDSTIETKWENGYFKGYFSSNGILTEEGIMENNLEQGVWKIYSKNDGSLKQIAEFKDGQSNGKRESYWNNGKLSSASYWNMNIQIGEFTSYYKNGNLKEKYSLKNQEYHGLSENYYENGFLESSRKYWQGNSCDTNKSFYETGTLEKLQVINLDTLTLENTGTEFRYYPNGQLDCAFNFKNLKLDGQFIRYNENGTIIEESNRLGGVPNGPFIIYYNTGQKEYEGNVILGRPNGEILYYHKDGTLDKSINFQNGIAQDSIIY